MPNRRSLSLKVCSIAVVFMLAACGGKDKSTDPTLQFYREDVSPLLTKQTLLFSAHNSTHLDTEGWVEGLNEIEAGLSGIAIPQRFQASHLRWLRVLDIQREGINRVSEADLNAENGLESRAKELNDQAQVLFLEARLLFEQIIVDINTN